MNTTSIVTLNERDHTDSGGIDEESVYLSDISENIQSQRLKGAGIMGFCIENEFFG